MSVVFPTIGIIIYHSLFKQSILFQSINFSYDYRSNPKGFKDPFKTHPDDNNSEHVLPLKILKYMEQAVMGVDILRWEGLPNPTWNR